MSKFENVLFIILIVMSAVAVPLNFMIGNKQAAMWGLMATLWTTNYYLLKRSKS